MSRRQFFGMPSTKQAPRIWKGDGIYGLHKVSVKHWWKPERELHEGFTWSQNPSGEEGGGKELGPVQKQKPKAGEDGRIVSGKVLGWRNCYCVWWRSPYGNIKPDKAMVSTEMSRMLIWKSRRAVRAGRWMGTWGLKELPVCIQTVSS